MRVLDSGVGAADNSFSCFVNPEVLFTEQ